MHELLKDFLNSDPLMGTYAIIVVYFFFGHILKATKVWNKSAMRRSILFSYYVILMVITLGGTMLHDGSRLYWAFLLLLSYALANLSASHLDQANRKKEVNNDNSVSDQDIVDNQ